MFGRSDRIIAGVLVFILASFFIPSYPTLAVSAAVMRTDRPVYSYNVKEVLLSGSGFLPGRYYVWLRKAGENQSRYTDVSFESTSAGNIPYPSVKLSFDPRVMGTYIVTLSTVISTDTETAKCSYGLFGPTRSVYERREMIQATGGGATPGSTVRIEVRTPRDTLAHNASAVADDKGEFTYKWYLENNVQTGSWLLSANGPGTYDAVGERWHIDTTFGVKLASLRMSINVQPSATYQRAQKATIVFTVRYPDASPVVNLKKDSKPVAVTSGDTIVEHLPLVLTDPLNGIWVAEFYVAKNETLAKNFTFTVSVGVFDDGYGNVAPVNLLKSAPFRTVPSKLDVSVNPSKPAFEIVFDSIVVNATVKYPDNTRMIDGTVVAHIKRDSGNETLTMRYDEKTRDWRFSRHLSISDIPSIGKWTIEIAASDTYGNSGTGEFTFDVSTLWFVISCLAASILVVVLARWVSEEKALLHAMRHKSKQDEVKPS